MVYQLVYVSRASGELDEKSLDGILATARANNGEKNITGMLLHHDGAFIQVLEGDEREVEELFDLIDADPRHEDTNVVLRTEVEERAFEQWSMGYRRAQSIEEVPEGFHHFLQRGYRRQTEADDLAARKALLAFRDGRWRT